MVSSYIISNNSSLCTALYTMNADDDNDDDNDDNDEACVH